MGLVEGTNCGFCTSAPSADPEGANSTYVDNSPRSCKFTSPADAVTIIEMGWYNNNGSENGCVFEIGIYDDDNGPGSLLESDTGTLTTSVGWYKVDGLNWSISSSTTYWFAVVCEDTATRTDTDFDSDTGNYLKRNQLQETLPATWSTLDQDVNFFGAFYAIYSTGGTNTQINIGDNWKEISAVKINIGDSWKEIAAMQINIGDAWKSIF